MTLAEQIAADNSAVFLNAEEFAASVTYTPAGGTPVSLTAILGDEEVNEEEGPHGVEQVRRRSVFVNTDPTAASGGMTSPKLNDTVTIGGEVWAIESFEISGGMAALTVVIEASAELSREGHRE